MHSQQFLNIDRLLSQTVFFWQFSAFHSSDYPWRVTHPTLSHWLDKLTLDEVQHLKQTPEQLVQELSLFIPEVSELYSVSQLEFLEASQPVMPQGANSGINGRKWEQITKLSALGIQYLEPKEQWLEWCGGKGYLGRVLNIASGKPVMTLEWQDALCISGQEYADKKDLKITFIQGDALSETSSLLIKPSQHAIALHACGDLHVSLIRKGIDKGIDAVTLSPCCFHLTESSQYKGLSSLSIQSEIRLSKDDLRLPLQETVTAGKRTQHHREQEMQFRLGFNALQQFLTKSDHYIPVPSIKKSLLGDGFEAFCLWASEHKKRPLPKGIDFSYWLNKGKEAFIMMEKCDVVQHVFKRPLEVWLCLDRVLLLEEAGYRVRIGEFCLKEETPRNIVIQAKK